MWSQLAMRIDQSCVKMHDIMNEGITKLFNWFCKSITSKFVRTLKEINIAFLPYESQIFSLDNSETFQYYYKPTKMAGWNEMLERVATQIVTLCATLGNTPDWRKRASQLIILDRGFDSVTPLLHELTLQAMAYDLLPIENDVLLNTRQSITARRFLLDENDEIWAQYRHEHIAKVTRNIADIVKKFQADHKGQEKHGTR
ncbi:putative Protein ROP [Hypsibius exemplaris]|uniref:Uncharacterized protein n=1 Tax=Hypsibius exemplaris TaxID=2072580 RepID=A0A9X6NGY8_HYPEX|nr:putative Protein ROP [Hypsibius exemplaris]